MKRYSLVLLVIVVLTIVGFYLWTAWEANKKSDDLLSHFKEIDRDLVHSNDSIYNSKGIDAANKLYPVSLIKSQIILLIDSLKENPEVLSKNSKRMELSKQSQLDLERLLSSIQQLNILKRDITDSETPDTLNYWALSEKFSGEKWLSIFGKSSKEEIFTYLNYLRNATLSVE